MSKLTIAVDKFAKLVVKHASYPTIERAKPLVKNVIASLKSNPLMEGVYYASNVELQRLPESFKVSFILNVSKKAYQKLQENRNQRAILINNALQTAFTKYFPEITFQFGFQDLAIDEPGWFDDEVD